MGVQFIEPVLATCELGGGAFSIGIGGYVLVEPVINMYSAVVDVVEPVEGFSPAGVYVVGVEFGSMVGVSPKAVEGCGIEGKVPL